MHRKDLEHQYTWFRAEIEVMERKIIDRENDLEKLNEASNLLINETEEFK